MKIVLLPGMDGTGNLFSPLLQALSEFECEVISLPQSGSQDYASLTMYVKGKLPDSDFILVAESFSGPIGAGLAKEGVKNMKGIIFVATFLSAPSKFLIAMARALPLKFLSSLPLAKLFYKALFLGSGASNELTSMFQYTLQSLPPELIKARLSSMYSLEFKLGSFEFPAGYIQAVSDRLVPSEKTIEFSGSFKNLIVRTIDGPHFILQAKPVQCAVAITELTYLLTSQGSWTASLPAIRSVRSVREIS